MADQALDAPTEGVDNGVDGKKRRMLVIAAVTLVLFGGGLAALFLLQGDAEPGSAQAVAEEPQGEPRYYKLEPVFVVHLPPGGKAKMLQVGLQVFSRDPDLGEILERYSPMLRHHLLNVLSNQQADTLHTRVGREALQGALQDELRRRLAAVGEDQVHIGALYFTQFVMQ